jgi:hypothetical protein
MGSLPKLVMAGLDPAIRTQTVQALPLDVDARIKSGHDENGKAIAPVRMPL